MSEKELLALKKLLEVVNETGYGLETFRAYNTIQVWMDKQKGKQ